jgi:hypothetical protein
VEVELRSIRHVNMAGKEGKTDLKWLIKYKREIWPKKSNVRC